MLDRAKLMQAVSCAADDLFVDISSEISLSRTVWQTLMNDPELLAAIRYMESQWVLPLWFERPDKSYNITSVDTYWVVSVDGSQIYPDKHQGTSCFLINIGVIALSYGVKNRAPVTLSSDPYVFTGKQRSDLLDVSIDVVNCFRQEYELRAGLEYVQNCAIKDPGTKPVLLFDGSLIFWHLESKELELKQTFLSCYLALLEQLYEQRIPVGWYISLPKSKDLINIIRRGIVKIPSVTSDDRAVDCMVDSTVAHFFLSPNTRSTVFRSQSPICEYYPDHLKPYFLYVHMGEEMGRIEVPAWIAQDSELLDFVISVTMDQCKKGNGYPIAIAEAHEQAVVKGPDREFFYQLISKVAIAQKRRVTLSRKAQKKRIIGV